MAGIGFEAGHESRCAMSPCQSCGQSPAPSYLGLAFDWKARTVSRPGSAQEARPVRLPHSLMMMLDALCGGRGEIVSDAVLLAAYRTGTATCPRLISKKVSALRCAIAPLGLGIAIARARGYRLLATADETEAA